MAFLLISNKLSGHLVQLDIVSFATRNAEGSQEWGGVRGGGFGFTMGGMGKFLKSFYIVGRRPPLFYEDPRPPILPTPYPFSSNFVNPPLPHFLVPSNPHPSVLFVVLLLRLNG